MKDKFFASGNRRGLRRNPFVHAVFMHLYGTTKGLHVKADAARVVAMLDELFDQIGGGRRGRPEVLARFQRVFESSVGSAGGGYLEALTVPPRGCVHWYRVRWHKPGMLKHGWRWQSGEVGELFRMEMGSTQRLSLHDMV